MLKKELRKLYREKRNALAAPEKVKLDDLLLIQFQTVVLPMLNTVFSYWPIEENNEPNTHLITDFLEFRSPGLQLVYPKIDDVSGTMQAILVDEDTRFTRNHFNVYEPENGEVIAAAGIDLVIVPLLAVDRKGYRVGYGKGYYDKFLAGCREDCMKAGFSYFEPVTAIDDCHDFDVPLDLCITPQAVYVF
jgi:5-formyltetrahydrofolate cyclo-ligase